MSTVQKNPNLSRRQFINTSLLSGVAIMSGGVLSGLSAAAAPTRFHFELSLAQWSLHKALFANEISALDFPVVARKTYDIGAVEYVNQFF